jgi:anaerobic selenocysteine-containing dehydrogenase
MTERIGRRRFIRGGLAAAMLAGTVGCRGAPLSEIFGRAGEEELPLGPVSWVRSVCLQCPGGCGIAVKRVLGKAIKIEGSPDYPANRGGICPKGQAGLQVLYDPDRIPGPLKRAGARGAGEWTAIGWDEALEMLAGRLLALRERGEAHRLGFLGGRYRGSMRGLVRRFLEAYGSPNAIENTCSSALLAAELVFGTPVRTGFDLAAAAYVICFGTSLLEAGWATASVLRQYGHARRGRVGRRLKMVSVDPRFSVTAAKADEWIRIRPGTDGALALGLAHVLVRDGLYDREYVERRTFGFAPWVDSEGVEHLGFREMVLADYAPERVAAITGVPAETIERLAREMAETPPALALAERGASAHSNGTYTRMAVLALDALLGSIERPGGILLHREPPLTPWPAPVLDARSREGLARERIDGAGGARLPLAASGVSALAEALLAGRPYGLDTLLIYYTNPVFSTPEGERFRRALAQVPFVVSFSPFMDETTALADLVLPDHTYLERWQDDVMLPGFGHAIYGVRQPVIRPRLNTRNSGDVLLALAARLGGAVAEACPWESYREVMRYRARGLFESGRGSIAARDFESFWRELCRVGGWWEDPDRPVYRSVFPTPSGRFEFYSQGMERRLRALAEAEAARGGGDPGAALERLLAGMGIAARGDRVFLPHHEETRREGDAEEYPLLLVNYKTMMHAEGRGANQPWLQESFSARLNERWGAWLEIDPEDAEQLGIEDGEMVWLESPRGRIRVKARLFPGSRGVVSMPYEYGHQAYGRWAAGRGVTANALAGTVVDPLAGMSADQGIRVRVRRA